MSASSLAAASHRARSVTAVNSVKSIPGWVRRSPPTLTIAWLSAALDREEDPNERALLDESLRYGLQALAGAEVGLR